MCRRRAAGGGISIWDKTLEDIGCGSYSPETPPEIITKADFTGGGDGFVFDPETFDLFANFKNLQPGITRSQIVEVRNSSPNKAEIFLRAEDISQSFSDPETLALVEKLLKEYAVITITDDSGRVIYNGPVWGEPYSDAASPETMRYDISLGVFESGEIKNLHIQLQIDPNMGNEYQSLLGLIKWVWSAEEMDPPPEGMITLNGAKTWHHGSNPVENRPQELVIHVKADGQIISTQPVTEADHWRWSFTLPAYDAQGDKIQYTIDEDPLPGYSTTVSGIDVTNTHESHAEVTVSGTKTWDHGANTSNRPESIIVHVKQDGLIVASKRITATDGWSWAFERLPKYNENGDLAEYTVGEERVPYYTLTKTEGYHLTNRFNGFDYPGDSPDTGNEGTTLWLWACLSAASLIMAAVLLCIRYRAAGRRKQPSA